jgi:hypothetical protein
MGFAGQASVLLGLTLWHHHGGRHGLDTHHLGQTSPANLHLRA